MRRPSARATTDVQVARRDLDRVAVGVGIVDDVKDELHRALGADIHARRQVALARVRKGEPRLWQAVAVLPPQRHQSQPVRNKLVVQHRRVFVNVDEVNGQARNLRARKK